MAKLKGITVTLLAKTLVGDDPFGNPLIEEKEIKVSNVLIAPVTADDVINKLNLHGKKAKYKLAIPKGDLNDWKDVTVFFFGQKWKTVGLPLEGIEELIPLDWNKQVMVERYG